MLFNFMHYLFLLLIFIITSSCEIENKEPEEIEGCCHEDAWNYNSETTIHNDDLCIYDFTFLNPVSDTAWGIAQSQTILWEGGDANLNLTIIIDDIELNRSDPVIIAENVPNTGTYEWVVADTLLGDKRIGLLQDINQDDIFDTINDLVSYSDNFSICGEGIDDADSDGICDDVDDCVGEYDCADECNGDGEDEDEDGICDDIDDCVGDYDECGECNGDGINEGDCDCDGNIIDECGECGGDGSSCEILPFEFLSPLDGDEWINGSEQIISWTGGSTFMPLKISLIASETDESEWYTLDTIILETENTGSYNWTVVCEDNDGNCPEGPKWISIQQDWNGDENDEYSFQYMYSEQFFIISE